MDNSEMLSMLKVDLGITTTAYDERLSNLLEAAADQITAEGATGFDPSGSNKDANLTIMYAAWMWRKRDNMEGMPRMLRWQLNNRVFEGKMS